jgi:dTDP-4-amino-4,6-dideoxygalactose transaminase
MSNTQTASQITLSRHRRPAPPNRWSQWPVFDQEQITAATEVLQSGRVNYWTGDQGRQFEREFADYTHCKYAVAVANGTVALELALHATGVEQGDEVIVPSRTFIATASAVVARRATPVCADVDPCTQNITADTIAAQVTSRTKAIIVVHLAGWPCDMTPIMKLAKRLDLIVIEDCAQAHGARYLGQPVGSLGDVAAFSFCQDKIMTTAGEGGMVVTNQEEVWRKAWSYKDHGKSYHAVHEQEHPPGFRWLHESFGTNMRMTEVQSAVGRVALQRLDTWVHTRRQYAAQLSGAFSGIDTVTACCPPSDIYHSYYKYYALVNPKDLKAEWNRDRILQEITNLGVPCYSGSCSEIYLEKAFPKDLQPARRFPQARLLGENSLMFLVDPSLTPQQITRTAEVAKQIFLLASASQPDRAARPYSA